MVIEGKEHDARLIPGVSFLFETKQEVQGRATLLEIYPWSEHPYKVEYITPDGDKRIEVFKFTDFKRLALLPKGWRWTFIQ